MKNNPFIKYFENPEGHIPIQSERNETMSNTLTPELLQKFAPKLGAANAAILVEILNKSEVNTPLRQAHFLAQAAHESLLFSITKENLNYSAAGLKAIFPKYFQTDAIRAQYARKPEAIANRAYANRMGNGPEASGDGWKYRGRGYFQLTGKNNYEKFSKDTYGDTRILLNPDVVAEPADAMKSSLWYWKNNNLSNWADKDNVTALSKAINLGNPHSNATPHGLEDRKKYLAKAKSLLGI